MEHNSTPTWRHPKLGEFTYDGSWSALVFVPAFDVFTYGRGLGNSEKLKGQCTLSFATYSRDELPSEEASALAARVLANAPALARAVIEALWDDFNGRGPDSGMWWHGYLSEVNEGLDRPVQGPDDLHKVMRLFQIYLCDFLDPDGRMLAYLCFEAEFEIEHNVGVLTDGISILGTGYQADVSPFRAS